MNRIRSLTCVLLLAALGTVPAFAQPAHQTYDVTKTFQLTIYGPVPPHTAFSVLYGEQFNRAVRYFCGPIEGAPDCGISSIPSDNGVVHTVDITWPRGTDLYFAVRVHLDDSENGTTFYEDVETLNDNMTNTVSYTFAPASPSPTPSASASPSPTPSAPASPSPVPSAPASPSPAPSAPPTPPRLPDTGLPDLPLGGLAAGVVFVASGLLMRRRR